MLSPSMSRAVATSVAICTNACCGVRTLIACQLRFSTSTIGRFKMSFIKISFHELVTVFVLYCEIFPALRIESRGCRDLAAARECQRRRAQAIALEEAVERFRV